MKCCPISFRTMFATFMSLSVFFTAGGLWRRSARFADYFYRIVPDENGSAKRGFGSYRGALVFGSILDPTVVSATSSFRHDTYPLVDPRFGKVELLKPIPDFKASGLGFGFSTGELKLDVPMVGFIFPNSMMAFLTPKRRYRATYVPYYFLMLLAAIQPARLIARALRARNSPESQEKRTRAAGLQFEEATTSSPSTTILDAQS